MGYKTTVAKSSRSFRDLQDNGESTQPAAMVLNYIFEDITTINVATGGVLKKPRLRILFRQSQFFAKNTKLILHMMSLHIQHKKVCFFYKNHEENTSARVPTNFRYFIGFAQIVSHYSDK